jgi:choice-of-anchor C domain-containing protein
VTPNLRSVLAVLALALSAAPAHPGNLVANGSFESPALSSGAVAGYANGQDLGGWTVEAGGVDQVRAPYWQAADGAHSLDLNGTNPGGVRQTVATTPGERYEISFAIAGNPECGASIKSLGVYWAGPIAYGDTFDTTTTTTTAMGWRIPRSLGVRATAATTEIAFRALSPLGGCGPAIDRVEVVPQVSPYREVQLVSRNLAGTGTGSAPGTSAAESVLYWPQQVSADGRFVAFDGGAADLVANDGDTEYDVFVHDFATRTTEILSRGPGGAAANDDSAVPYMSNNGRFVLYASNASNLATTGPNPTNHQQNLWLFDRQARTNRLASVNVTGDAGSFIHTVGQGVSEDGRYVMMLSPSANLVTPAPTGGRLQVYVRDMQAATNVLVTRNVAGTDGGNGAVQRAVMSRDGRYVAFASFATDLTVAGDANGMSDVFVWDRQTGATTLVSRTPTGNAGAGDSFVRGISDDGTRIAFTSSAADLVAGDGNGAVDAFVYDTLAGTVQLASCAGACNASVSGGASDAKLSVDGRYVLFPTTAALAGNDLNGGTDLYVRDLVAGTTEWITVGTAAASSVQAHSMSRDGRYVAFTSNAPLTPDDANGTMGDLYVRDRSAGRTYLISRGAYGATRGGAANEALFAGTRVVFDNGSGNLTAESDTNSENDVFSVDLVGLERMFLDGFE